MPRDVFSRAGFFGNSEASGKHPWRQAEALTRHPRGIQETPSRHAGGTGLQRPLREKTCNPSQVKCKSSINKSILQGVFEGRCHECVFIYSNLRRAPTRAGSGEQHRALTLDRQNAISSSWLGNNNKHNSKQTNKQTDRQRQTDKQTDKQTNRQTD